MNQKLYVEKNGKILRCGYTTGSCAAAASKAALIMLLTGSDIHNVSIITPKGIEFCAEILDITRNHVDNSVSCAVIKDGGDDPDVTSGVLIYAKVRLNDSGTVVIDGGEGVGRVTKPGLDRPVGDAAINSTPRTMISKNIKETLQKYDRASCGAEVIISVPGGDRIAAKTFNPKLGIVGGISILGTTGIVEPMSDQALLDTIRTEINVRMSEGTEVLVAAPGNYGLSFLSERYGISQESAVMCSNFVYDMVEMAAEAGVKKLLFVGHIGKLVKVAGGIKNTHSMYGDRRMEILSNLCREYAGEEQFAQIKEEFSECVMTDSAVSIIKRAGIDKEVFCDMADRIKRYMEEWSVNRLKVEVIVFSNENTELVQTGGVKTLLECLK